MNVRVRPPRPDELGEVARLSARCFEHGAWDEEALASELERPFAEVWVAESPSGALLGYAVGWFVADDAELLTVGTDPVARGAGIGKRLVERIQRSSVERGARSLLLEVREDNVAARRLYEALGFATLDVRRRYYRDGADARVMTWTP